MDNIYDPITAVILAGGRNSRFGGVDKAFLPVGGVPMIELISGRLGELFGKILVVTNSPGSYEGYGNLTAIGDIYRESGPLGGIHAAMMHATTPFIFVVSCDMPFIDGEIIGRQTDRFFRHKNADALIPRVNSNIEPLHSIYSVSLAQSLGEFLSAASDLSIRAFLRPLNVVYMDLPATGQVLKAFSNINSPGDLPAETGG